MRDYSLDTDQTDLFRFDGDTNSIRFLKKEELFGSESPDISLRSSGGPSGRDYEALKDAHGRRSAPARRVDERRSAQVTRDPLTWALDPNRYDYPGVDTVEPARLHSRRSKRARTADEREIAPLADSREQWARDPGRYDWKGVDTPREGYGATKGTPIPDAELEMTGGLFGGPATAEALADEEFSAVSAAPMTPSSTGLRREADEDPFRDADLDEFEKLFDATRLDGSGGGGWF